jgi:hypothetical protein
MSSFTLASSLPNKEDIIDHHPDLRQSQTEADLDSSIGISECPRLLTYSTVTV